MVVSMVSVLVCSTARNGAYSSALGIQEYCKLSQHSSVESYANEFQNLCAEIATLAMSAGDKIHRFIDELKPEMRLKVVDPLNDAQPWEDFHRLVTY